MEKLVLLYKSIVSLFLLSLYSGCVMDYDIARNFDKTFKKQVVLNSFICPDSTLSVKLYWSKKYNDPAEFEIIEKAEVELYEEGKLIKSGEAFSGFFESGIYPQSNKSYSIKVTVPDHGIVSASTRIPRAATSEIKYLNYSISRNYYHLELNRIKPSDKLRSVWLNAYGIYMKTGRAKDDSDFYTDNPFIDQINSAMDNTDIYERGSNTVFEYFIRIPSPNFGYIDPLNFVIDARYKKLIIYDWDESYEDVEYEEEKLTEIVLSMISPSDDYDKYRKSLYQQILFNYEPDTPFLDEKVSVYSNVENGLGIFAGYSQYVFKQKID